MIFYRQPKPFNRFHHAGVPSIDSSDPSENGAVKSLRLLLHEPCTLNRIQSYAREYGVCLHTVSLGLRRVYSETKLFSHYVGMG